MRYFGKNTRPFTAICQNGFGRQIITTNKAVIDANNVVEELNNALKVHRMNAVEIDYLDKYYTGDQPILYRQKQNRPEVNNKVVANLALYAVETHTSEMAGEPIQYVLRGTDEKKSEEIARLNTIIGSEDKSCDDIELCRWRSICGTAYRFIGNEEDDQLLDESDFYLSVEDPRDTFVAYKSDRPDKPMFSCQIREDEDNTKIYNVYTKSFFFQIKNDEIIHMGLNGNGAIPVIEYPNNGRRLSDIEITFSITDEINKMASDRSNGIEQFVSAWVKFVNCEIDVETYRAMRQEGALVVKSNNGTENKADVDVMTSELNQTETQVAVQELFDKFLLIQGMASRNATSSDGGSTAGAVELRNGHYDAEKRAELAEPIFKKSERKMLRIVLNRLRINNGFTLLPSDVEIHISRTKMDNMQVKAQVLKMLLDCGVKYERAIKTIGLFSDPEQVAIESKKRMELLYPETIEQPIEPQEVIEVDENK